MTGVQTCALPISKELNTLVIMMAGAGGLLAFGGQLAEMMLELMRINFMLPREVIMDDHYMGLYFLNAGKAALVAIQPLMLTMVLAALIGPIALGGWLFSTDTMVPKFSRMNPLSGIKRMFSVQALVELIKAFAKFFIILIVALVVLSKDRGDLVSIAHEPLELAIIHSEIGRASCRERVS